jgi:hypothetical protein
MKRGIVAGVLSCATLLTALAISAQPIDDFNVFWEKFKSAVIKGDKETVAELSQFPIGMSYGISPIRNKAQLLRRYREVFNEQSDAAKCFAKNKPEKDSTNPKVFTVACPDQSGAEVVVYQFKRTKLGWKFVALDNINE